VAASEDRMGAQPAGKVALLRLFQDETWQGNYDDVPVYGNGALHEPYRWSRSALRAHTPRHSGLVTSHSAR
jgi:hypothetical protein